ncbi:(deoxy)nucleoside triphosphate pyrophosphohydrolase [Rapidithrix thailandica]|uniref:8-oxo-dGTP diphosphatase n=1 Tax=Rapidithrix thailandica TaxID=413964 RepID=A0AAW9SJV6_9BACT
MSNKIIIVTCAIIEYEGKVLVAQRSETMAHPLQWEFPGGKLHTRELPEKCIVREIMEELQLSFSIRYRLHSCEYDYGHKQIRLLPFVGTCTHKEVKLLEHKRIKWLEREELRHLDWCKADIPVLEQYLSTRSSK